MDGTDRDASLGWTGIETYQLVETLGGAETGGAYGKGEGGSGGGQDNGEVTQEAGQCKAR